MNCWRIATRSGCFACSRNSPDTSGSKAGSKVSDREQAAAKAATLGLATIRRIEGQDGPVMGYVSTLMRIQSAFEQAGILFLDDDAGGGIGVRLEKKPQRG